MWKLIVTVVACLMILPVLLVVSVIYRDLSLDQFSKTTLLGNTSSKSIEEHNDHLLGGLLAPSSDENSCLSKYQSILHRKNSPHKPSSYLLSRLQKYEELHKKCGPHTKSYNKAIENLKLTSDNLVEQPDCKYVVWIASSGLGNKMLTITSAFLYSLLTDRVLLVDRGNDLDDLFCEPFPETSWFLPLDFPLYPLQFDYNSPQSYGSMLKRNMINSTILPPFVYLHLNHDYNEKDKLFFCDEGQYLLQKVPWLAIRSNNYFVPSFFLMPFFNQELSELFPSKVLIFHHLGRYLFHPSNTVWGIITRFYQTYLENADQKVGIQIRVFEKYLGEENADQGPPPYQKLFDQIVDCFLKEKLLPNVVVGDSFIKSENQKSKAVLVTSLNSVYFEKLRNMYLENPTVTGEIVRVCQPSNEGSQQTDKKNHDQKALAEIYLLSYTDVLITTGQSTFGYVAQGLGGLKPWIILHKPVNEMVPSPSCIRGMSLEPCFHSPPNLDCNAKTQIDTGSVVPHVGHCEDVSSGVKLVEH